VTRNHAELRSGARRAGFTRRGAALLLLLLPTTASRASVPARPSEIIVFGDSLSDTGNAYIATLHGKAPSPPYYHGRFSNGPVWIEDFAAKFGLTIAPALSGGTDFAMAGAKTGSGADRLSYQADLYLLLSAFSRPDPRALYVVFAGANDVRSALDENDPAPALAHAALSIRHVIEHLAAHGAVNFLVPNLPDRGATPAARMHGMAAEEKTLTWAYNAGLDAALRDLPGKLRINLVRVDFWSSVEHTLAAPQQLGFTNTTEPCLIHDKTGYRQCAEPEKYLFWDNNHPTRQEHLSLAAAALAAYAAAAPSAATGDAAPAIHAVGTGAVEQEVLRTVSAQLHPAATAPGG
jgi:phospholipase/lecithinase/hemolysin